MRRRERARVREKEEKRKGIEMRKREVKKE